MTHNFDFLMKVYIARKDFENLVYRIGGFKFCTFPLYSEASLNLKTLQFYYYGLEVLDAGRIESVSFFFVVTGKKKWDF